MSSSKFSSQEQFLEKNVQNQIIKQALSEQVKEKRSKTDRRRNAINFKKHFMQNLGKERARKIRIILDKEKVRKLGN